MSTPAPAVPTTLTIEGEVQSSDDLIIAGTVRGTVHVNGTLEVRAGAVCQAQVRALRCEVHGEMIGDVICSEAIVVAAGARVVGDLRAPDVSVAPGAEVDGRIDLLAPEPQRAPRARHVAGVRGTRPSRPLPPTGSSS